MSKSKRLWLFKIISICIPIFLLVIVELLLRAFQYGHDLRLFITYPADNRYLVLNPQASKKYFLNQRIATTGNTELFRKEKPAGTCRIFVLGESTTIGYPYFHNGAFHRWLQYRLMRNYPDKDFEVINLSLTAVNSFTVLGFAKEVAAYQPDAVLIYAGHNEYYGSLGVGSTERIAGNTGLVNLVLALRNFRLMQLFTSTYEKIVRAAVPAEAGNGKARMELMVANQQIPFNSTLYQRGVTQFTTNMNAVLNYLDKRQIPVFVSTLVDNEKDLPPFTSELPADSSVRRRFERSYNTALQALQTGDSASALAGFTAADKLCHTHAATHYYIGRLSLKDSTTASKELVTAKDLDQLRFRAPAVFNGILAKLCSQYQHAHLVDAKAAFEQASPGHIIGNELLLEHVHPNLEGYAILSDVFYKALQQAHILPADTADAMDFTRLRQTMPVTAVDSLAGAYRIYMLKKSWPFRQTPDTLQIATEEQRLAAGLAFQQTSWPQVMDTLYTYYTGRKEWAKACRVVETLLLEFPQETSLYDKAANLYGQMNDLDNAVFYFRKTFALSPTFETARTLFVLYLKMDRPDAALPYLDYAILHNDKGMNLAPVKQLAQEVIRLEQTAGSRPATEEIMRPVVNKYIQMGNNDGAATYLQKILKTEPGNKAALLLLENIQEKQQ
ncbi:hypothetical protein F0L74_14060 [Chitinophaga agrisoli]|uniref:GDSL-like lipase/acylhydrolase family protein n=1 Tax=Chitinophaga agrisoli TaxID=2607653 RepID=A0A5B2VZN6_9BACT|nr:hypothetical protein [Chitinophaga agrisoli]KAA2243607.1 hypothetical protein F0L74_14060 [Chitinophaga agrisoli]